MFSLVHVGLEVGDRTLFSNLNFEFDRRHGTRIVYALIGPNGAGKSSLMKILAGAIKPDEGQVRSDVVAAYVPQDAPQTKAASTSPILSGGEWMRTQIEAAIGQSPDWLLLDEPTNNLDSEGRAFVYDFIRGWHGGCLLISHDRELLRCADEILELTAQGLRHFTCSFDEYWEQRQATRERKTEELANAKREKKKQEKKRQDQKEAQEKRMRQAERSAPNQGLPQILLGARKRAAQKTLGKVQIQAEKAISEAERIERNALEEQLLDPFLRLDFAGAAVPASRTILQLESFNLCWPASSIPLWREPLSLALHGPERIRIRGGNGSGKTSLLRTLLNRYANKPAMMQERGTLFCGARHLVYLDQDYSLLDPKQTVLENVEARSRFNRTQLRNELAFYGFKGDQVFQKAESLSGGERVKAALAKIFLGEELPDLVVLDEPTNNLDFYSIESLQRALNRYQGALVLVSHDEAFVKASGITATYDLTKT